MKERLDVLLTIRGLAVNAKEAHALVLSGSVYSNTKRLEKSGEKFPLDIPLEIKTKRNHKWVSRGGLKLVHALNYFQIDPSGFLALDIGASTGGFTDVLLHNGVSKVYAVDVGYGELAWKLQQDKRVIVLDRTNAKNLTAEQHIPEKVDIIVCDASFIGLQSVLPVPLGFAKPEAYLVALIKPQFEVTKYQVGEGGVVRDPILHSKVCVSIRDWLSSLPGWKVLDITESPITGTEGNKEFLIGAKYEQPVY